jgi:hypothetical protein
MNKHSWSEEYYTDGSPVYSSMHDELVKTAEDHVLWEERFTVLDKRVELWDPPHTEGNLWRRMQKLHDLVWGPYSNCIHCQARFKPTL